MINLNNERSRIIYDMKNCDSSEENKIQLCNYLIKIEQNEDWEEIIPCNTISKVIEICALEKRICRVYERAGSCGKNWQYLCDISKGVI